MIKEFKNIKLERCNKDDIEITFDNSLDGNLLKIYYSNSPDFNSKTMLLEASSNKIKFKDPNPNKRDYYLLECPGFKDAMIAERVLPLTGACNFRDLGGFKTEDGRLVKWDKFYRSDRLCDLTENDLKYLESLNLKSILDYRSEQEAQYEEDKEIGNAKYINISAMPIEGKFNGNLDMHYLLKNGAKVFGEVGNPVDMLGNSYKKMVFENKAFKKLIEIVMEEDERPFVQHCKSGKDRTGIGSALLLLLLGVPMETVKDDYLASNIYRKAFNDSYLAKYKQFLDTPEKEGIFKIVMEVREEYFNAAFDTILNKYKNLDDYFKEEYSLSKDDIEKIRNKYLY